MEEKIRLPNSALYKFSKGMINSLYKTNDITLEERNEILFDLAKLYDVVDETLIVF